MTTQQVLSAQAFSNDSININSKFFSGDMEFESSGFSLSRLLEGDLCDSELNEFHGLFETDAKDEDHSGDHLAATAAILDEALAFCSTQSNGANSTSSSPVTVTSSEAHTSVLGDNKQEMPIEFRNLANHHQQEQQQPKSNNNKRRKVSHEGGQQCHEHPHKQGGQLFGKRVSIAPFSSQAHILPRRVSMAGDSQEESKASNDFPKVASAPPRATQNAVPSKVAESSNCLKVKKHGVSEPTTTARPRSAKAASISNFSATPSSSNLGNKKFKEGVALTPEAEALVEATSAKMDLSLSEIVKKKQQGGQQAKDLKGLAPDELHRNRNREHARNTRIRKKAYIEALKQTLNDLSDDREASKRKKELKQERDMQNRHVRFQVMEAFLNMNGSAENQNRDHYPRCAAILEDTFAFSAPATGGEGEKVYTGISEVMKQFGGFASQHLKPSASVNIRYQCDRTTLLMEGCNCILDWTGKTNGAVAHLGLKEEVTIAGTLRAQFNTSTNKLRSARLLCDTGALKR